MLSRMRLMFVVGAVVCLATACTATPAAAPAANSKPGDVQRAVRDAGTER